MHCRLHLENTLKVQIMASIPITIQIALCVRNGVIWIQDVEPSIVPGRVSKGKYMKEKDVCGGE